MCGGETEGAWVVGVVGRKGPKQQCQSTGMTGCLHEGLVWKREILKCQIEKVTLDQKE